MKYHKIHVDDLAAFVAQLEADGYSITHFAPMDTEHVHVVVERHPLSVELTTRRQGYTAR